MVKVITPILLVFRLFFSITVQWNRIKFGVLIAADSGSYCLILWHCSLSSSRVMVGAV